MRRKQNNIFSGKNRQRLLLAGLLLIAATVAGTFSLCRPEEGPNRCQATAEHADSLIRQRLSELYTDPASTERQLTALADSLRHDTVAWLRVMLFRSVAERRQGKAEAPMKVWKLVDTWCRQHPQDRGPLLGTAWLQRGVEMMEAGRFDTALVCLKQAVPLLAKGAPVTDRINGYINLADTEFTLGRPAAAAEAYHEAHLLADSAGRHRDLMAVRAGLGLVYIQLENYKEADRYLNEAAQFLHSETVPGQMFFHITRGNSLFFQKRYDEALAAFSEARALAERMNSAPHLAICNGNIGETLLMAGQTDKAEAYIRDGAAFAEAHPDADPSLRFYVGSLAGHLALTQGHTEEAGRLLRKADTLPVMVPRYRIRHYERLQHYAEKRGQWREALHYLTLAKNCDDSLRNLQVINNITEMENRYRRDTTLLHQQVVIAGYEAKTSRQRAYLFGFALLFVGIVLVASVLVVAMKRRNERRYRRQLKQVTQLRMNIVRNRMQPHYLFNVLGTILPKFRAYSELSPTLELLIDVLRSNLLLSDKAVVSLAEERVMVERFVALHHATCGSRPAVEWHVSAEVCPAMPVPAMCLQIPVENALKHAFGTLTAESRIDITARIESEALHLTITDNGDGFHPGQTVSTGRDTGSGLRILARTFELLNSRNGRAAQFHIKNLQAPEHGTRVEFVIPEGYRFE